MYVGGEIAELARIGRPEIGVVTAVQPVHLSRIGTIEAVEQAKGELVEALPPDGVAVLNADDERVRRMADRTTRPGHHLRLRRGRRRAGGGRRVRGRRRDALQPRRRRIAPRPSRSRRSAGSRVHNALAAAAVGLASGIAPSGSSRALAAGWSAPHRGALVRAGGVTIVDDSYNASPASVIAALDLLAGMPGRRVAVLGEMLELGDGQRAGHERVGAAAATVAELLVVVGAGSGRDCPRRARCRASRPDRIVEVADRDAALAALEASPSERRRRPRQGVARDRARPASSTTCVRRARARRRRR